MRKVTWKCIISGILTGALLLSPMAAFAEEEKVEPLMDEELIAETDGVEDGRSEEEPAEALILEDVEPADGEDEFTDEVAGEDAEDNLYEIADGLFEEEALEAADDTNIPIDETNFPDPLFRQFVISECDTDGDVALSPEEISRVDELYIEFDIEDDEADADDQMRSLAGIEYFTELINLTIESSVEPGIETLDLSSNSKLETLAISCGYLKDLNIGENSALRSISISGVGEGLEILDVSNHPSLEEIECYSSDALISIDVSGCQTLNRLSCYDNIYLESIDVSGCMNLDALSCAWNHSLASLAMTGCSKLTSLTCVDSELTELNVENYPNLTFLSCDVNHLTALNVAGNTHLETLYCSSNQLSSLELGSVPLEVLSCSWNNLQSLDVSGLSSLKQLWCGANPLQELDVSNNSNLVYLHCFNSGLEELNVRNNPLLEELYCHQNRFASLDISNCTILKDLYCNSTHYTIDGVECYGTMDQDDDEEYDDEEEGDSGDEINLDDFTGLAVDSGVEIITVNDPDHMHTYENWEVKTPATCTTDGVETGICECGQRTTRTVPAAGHAYGAWKVMVPATEETQGRQVRTCTRCGAKETKVIPKVAVKITISKAPSLKKPKAAAKGKATITWKKFKQTKKTKAVWKKIKKIELQYSTDSSFKTSVSKKLVGKSKTKLSVKGLKKNTTYYVRIRYTDGAGGYSKWSGTKKFTTKKK
ncbi:MAG: hypothetical protein IJ820_05120 [Lachnospiraceae bacterium]|nr:hypothetical protein [Lachnospiraceae bacterium]